MADSQTVAFRGHRLNERLEIYPGGAALLTDENVLVVADMHLGCEASLEYEGLSIPRVQTRKIESYMEDVIRHLGPDRVVVAGDLKHNFSRNLVQEWNDVVRFVNLLGRLAPLEVVKGNHDNYLGVILAEHKIPLRNELVVGETRILHGHSGARQPFPTIIGHIHPSIRIRDEVGAALKDHCFLYEPKEEILVVPALSIVAPGLDVVTQRYSDKASPILPEDGLARFSPIVFSDDKALVFPTVGELRESWRDAGAR